MTYDEQVNLLKAYLLDKLLSASYSWVISQLSFLAWGPLGFLTKKALSALLDFIINQSELTAFLKFIDIRTSRQGREYHDAILDFQTAKGSHNAKDIASAERRLKEAFKSFIRLTD